MSIGQSYNEIQEFKNEKMILKVEKKEGGKSSTVDQRVHRLLLR